MVRLDLESVLTRWKFGIQHPNLHEGDFSIHKEGSDAYFSSQIKTIWWRRSTSQLSVDYLHLPNKTQLDQVEAYWGMRWFIESMPDSYFPFGHPQAMRVGENKLSQLGLAKLVGFKTPKFLLSNDRDKLLHFTQDYEQVVVKPIHTTVVPVSTEEDVSLIAKSIPSADLRSRLQENPCIFLFLQESIKKQFDVRVNVFPSSSSACRIDPAPKMDGVDWRPFANDCKHSMIQVPDDIDNLCRKYLAKMGLKWGAFDFGVNENNEWIFFECNPNGQWLWIELKTRYPLSETVADELIKHLKK